MTNTGWVCIMILLHDETRSRKLEMEGDNISKIPEKALTISHEISHDIHHSCWFNLIRACSEQTGHFMMLVALSDQWPGPRGLTLHTQVTPERNLSSPGLPGQACRRQMINGGPKFRCEAPSQVDKDRVIACWLWTCPGIITEIRLHEGNIVHCAGQLCEYLQTFHGLAVPLSQNNNIAYCNQTLTSDPSRVFAQEPLDNGQWRSQSISPGPNHCMLPSQKSLS